MYTLPLTKIIISSILIVLLILAGVFLHQKGEPYNVILFSIHKVLTIVMIILMALVVLRFFRQEDVSMIYYVLSGIIALSLVGLLVSGGMLSLDKFHAAMLRIHQVSTLVFLGSYSFFLYQLFVFKAS